MRVAIFGGTGKTGILVLRQLLRAGHQVTALVRNPEKFKVDDSNLRIVHGDACAPEGLSQTIRNAEVVISTLSGGGGVLTTFGSNLVPAMKLEGVSRIISLIGASVRVRDDPHTIGLAVLHRLMSIVAKDVLADGKAYAAIIQASRLDYTLVRPPRLTDGPLTERVRHAASLKLSSLSSISRADVAAFMVKVALSGDYSRTAPMIVSK
jgi:putative NADH-flavin reductase